MFIEKIDKNSKGGSVDLSLMGMDFISRFMTVFSTLCNGENEIKNFSINSGSMNFIKILRSFGVKITLNDETNTLRILGKGGCPSLSQASEVINVEHSINNLILLIILLSNQNFKTFITGGREVLDMNLSFLEKYLKGINVIFNTENRLPMVIFGKPGHCDKTSFAAVNATDKSFLLLLSLFSKYNVINITDSDIREEFVECIFKYYDIELNERYSQNTNFLTRETKKSKEISLVKTNPLNLKARGFMVPVDIKEVFYAIFLFLFSDRGEMDISAVAVNEYNDYLVKILLDNGVNIQFKNQKIVNGIKISDLSVKQSSLKPLSISKLRLRDAVDYYMFIALLNIFKNNSFTLMGVDYIKKHDAANYKFMLKFCEMLGCNVVENGGDLDFISNRELQLTNKINLESFNPKVNMFLFLSTVSLGDGVNAKLDFDLVKEEFPNVGRVMDKLGFRVNA
jgi:5-enolpyruvylshikimate-3-phosphate synthase